MTVRNEIESNRGGRGSYRSTAAVGLALFVLAAHAEAATINTPPNGYSFGAFGPTNSYSEGAVFTALDTELVDYSFNISSNTPFSFESQVYAFNGTNVVGPALFTSIPDTTTTSDTRFTFTPGIKMTTGSTYIAFVTSDPGGASLGGSGYAFMDESNASGATSAYTAGNPASASWSTISGSDFALTADFTSAAVPEPSTTFLLATGLLGIGVLSRRSRA